MLTPSANHGYARRTQHAINASTQICKPLINARETNATMDSNANGVSATMAIATQADEASGEGMRRVALSLQP